MKGEDENEEEEEKEEEEEEEINAMRDEELVEQTGLEDIREEGEEPYMSERSGSGASIEEELPVITAEQFNKYMKSLIKLMVGSVTMMDWTTRGSSFLI